MTSLATTTAQSPTKRRPSFSHLRFTLELLLNEVGKAFLMLDRFLDTGVCRQNTIGSVEGELRSHEIWEIQVDSFLKLDHAAKNQTSDGSHEVVPIGAFPFSGPQAGISWVLPG